MHLENILIYPYYMNPWLALLNGLFPSWRFFDDVGPTLRLEVRVNGAEWLNALPPIERSWRGVFFNPEGNYLHACHNLLEHLGAECAILSAGEITARANYKITGNLARLQILKIMAPPFSYQFRLSRGREQVLISPLFEG